MVIQLYDLSLTTRWSSMKKELGRDFVLHFSDKRVFVAAEKQVDEVQSVTKTSDKTVLVASEKQAGVQTATKKSRNQGMISDKGGILFFD